MNVTQVDASLSFVNVHHVLETLPYGLVIVDHDWVVQYWNHSAEVITGIESKEVLHKSLWLKYPVHENALTFGQFQKALSSGRSLVYEEFRSSISQWIEVCLYPCDKAVTIYFRNITETKEKERRLKEINERSELVSRATSEAIWDWRCGENQFLWYGENFRKLFGYDIVNAYGDSSVWEDNIHPDQREQVVARHWDVVYNGGEYWSDQYWFRKANGEYAYVKDRAFIMRDAFGNPTRMIGSMDDITAQKLAEDALSESERNYRLLFNSSPEPQCIYDEETLQIITVNDAVVEEYGYSREALLQMSIMDLQKEPIMMKYLQYLDRKQREKSIPMGLWKHRNHKGERFIVDIVATRITYSQRPCVLVNISNVTEKIRLETKLLKLQKLQQRRISRAMIKGEEKQREELGKELHDNVNQLIASAKLMLESAVDDPGHRVDLIRLSAETLNTAIGEIRCLTRSLMPSAIMYAGLQASIHDLVATYKAVNQFSINFAFSGDEALIGNPIRITLFRIIQEQLNNISKYARAGNVVIDLQIHDQVELMIADDGIGFDPSLKRSGVGITNMENRTHLHHGTMSICTSPGEGCSIKVIIPCGARPLQGHSGC